MDTFTSSLNAAVKTVVDGHVQSIVDKAVSENTARLNAKHAEELKRKRKAFDDEIGSLRAKVRVLYESLDTLSDQLAFKSPGVACVFDRVLVKYVTELEHNTEHGRVTRTEEGTVFRVDANKFWGSTIEVFNCQDSGMSVRQLGHLTTSQILVWANQRLKLFQKVSQQQDVIVCAENHVYIDMSAVKAYLRLTK